MWDQFLHLECDRLNSHQTWWVGTPPKTIKRGSFWGLNSPGRPSVVALLLFDDTQRPTTAIYTQLGG